MAIVPTVSGGGGVGVGGEDWEQLERGVGEEELNWEQLANQGRVMNLIKKSKIILPWSMVIYQVIRWNGCIDVVFGSLKAVV